MEAHRRFSGVKATVRSKPSLYAVENAFQPAKEITDAARFAGRTDAVGTAYLGLMAAGSHIAIVGNRGIGKTSLARQVIQFGRGDNDLLVKFGLTHETTFDFLPIYYACGNSTKDTDDLLAALLSSKQCLSDWIYDIPKTRKMIHGLSPKLSAKLLGIGGEVGTQHTGEEASDLAISSHTLEVIFTNVVSDIVSSGVASDGILIVIDEFDQIDNRKASHHFLKLWLLMSRVSNFASWG
jgi:hypothetical protein